MTSALIPCLPEGIGSTWPALPLARGPGARERGVTPDASPRLPLGLRSRVETIVSACVVMGAFPTVTAPPTRPITSFSPGRALPRRVDPLVRRPDCPAQPYCRVGGPCPIAGSGPARGVTGVATAAGAGDADVCRLGTGASAMGGLSGCHHAGEVVTLGSFRSASRAAA